ncbi:MAG: DUF302 domain-containing protein [Bacteroidia bacterium]|nr:DUF302 domain-containing protein [Bacteroidia bacterium]
MNQSLIIEKKSPVNLDDTVQKITENALALGWTVPGIKEIDKMIFRNGGPLVLPVRLVELCHPQHAGEMLKSDKTKFSAVMMPCTIAVYEKKDGKTYVGYMNIRKTGDMFEGTIKEVMGEKVAVDQDKILNFLQ